ncbi:Fc.00g069140.m01.CDS01 [Cosmosporella sp. VM-42]
MGRRRAQDAAMALLRTASSSRSPVVLRRLNCSQLRCLSAATRRPPRSRVYDGRRLYATQAHDEAKNASIAVLGGGLTGLTTAYYLAKKLPPTAKITLYEGSDRLGGWIRTEKHPVDIEGKKGVVSFERGPRSFTSLSGNTWRYDDLVFYDLCLDLGLNYVSAPNKARYIYYPDHLVPLPPAIGLFDMVREPLFTEAMWGGLGLLLRAWRTKSLPVEDKSVADWIHDISLSRTAANHFASAMVHGIYGGDIDKLSARSVLDRIYWGWYMPNPGAGSRPMPIAEEAILDTLGQDKQIQKLALQPKGALLHFGAEGMETLPRALGQALKDQPNVNIKLNSPVKDVHYDTASQTVQIVGTKPSELPHTYDKVISTLTSQDLARVTNEKLPSLANSHSVSIMTVNIWYPQENLKPPGFGYLIPRSVPPENNPENALGVFFDSDVQTRSPDEPTGTKLFVLMGGHYYDNKTPPTEAEAIQQAKTLLERQLGIPRDTPCYAVARLAKECIPQHYVGHEKRMLTADKELEDNFGGKLAVAGGSYTRIGAMAALRAGYDIAAHTARKGLESTGLDVFKLTGFRVCPVEKIPVRRFKWDSRSY